MSGFLLEISWMFVRVFLSLLVAGLFMSFATAGSVFAKTPQNYSVSKKKSTKRLVKKRSKRKVVKKRRLVKGRKFGNKKRTVRYKRKRKWKKVTKVSLRVDGIKNLRHAKLTSRGRMSVAKDTRKNTVRSFGQRVSYKYRPGTVVLSNYTRRLYYVVRRGKVISYPIATPRPDEVWSGSTKISKKKLNPDWYPTPSMRKKNPKLPIKVAGGSKANPFGKRALYLGNSLYRIHGTNLPGSIGRAASGGCYRMRNSDISKLWRKVKIGTPVVVLTKRKI
jgi:lipoprotein-anchoring transpeptidase ErfK/SrfK